MTVKADDSEAVAAYPKLKEMLRKKQLERQRMLLDQQTKEDK
jgi:hypothetical protein